MDFSKKLEAAKYAAREAGGILFDYYSSGRAVAVRKKGVFDRVTDADEESERRIRGIISNAFPEDGFIGEEFRPIKEQSDFVWHVDPMCGTYNFEHGIPRFAVSESLEYKKELVLGVIYIPFFIKPGWGSSRKALLWAEKGNGAFLETSEGGIERLKVSEVSRLEDAMITTDFASEEKGRDIQLRMYSDILKRFQYAEVTGSTPYNLCNVACGITEGHIELFVPSLHRAAGMLIVKEAGGKVENMDNIYDERFVLATNGKVKIHNELLRIVKKFA